MVRYLAICIAVIVVTAAAWVWRREYLNSRDVPFPSDAEVRSSFLRAADWVLERREQLLKENNPMLWLFVREGAKASGEQRLLELAQTYQSSHTDGTLWHYIFDSSDREHVAGQYIPLPDYVPDYNRLFIYGATCNASVRDDPAVLALLSPSACGSTLAGLRAAWCRTHQLMGLRFIQRNHCEPDELTARTVGAVQGAIVSELRWDFRVGDAYIQKVLLLVESGRRRDVKAVWLRRILDSQRADGGWDGLDVITGLPGDRVLSWAHLYPTIVPRRPSNFHATAQALYLLALWRNEGLLSAGFLTEARVGPALGGE